MVFSDQSSQLLATCFPADSFVNKCRRSGNSPPGASGGAGLATAAVPRSGLLRFDGCANARRRFRVLRAGCAHDCTFLSILPVCIGSCHSVSVRARDSSEKSTGSYRYYRVCKNILFAGPMIGLRRIDIFRTRRRSTWTSCALALELAELAIASSTPSQDAALAVVRCAVA